MLRAHDILKLTAPRIQTQNGSLYNVNRSLMVTTLPIEILWCLIRNFYYYYAF